MQEKKSKVFVPLGWQTWLALSSLLAGFFLVSRYSNILFHFVAELFTVVIIFGIFIVTWNSRRFHANGYLLLIGISSLFIGIVDVLQTLSDERLVIFPGYGANFHAQLWILQRYMTALSFFLAPFFIGRKLNFGQVFTIMTVVTGASLAAIFGGVFPTGFVEGVGLTPFQVYSEYLVILIFIAALVVLLRYRNEFEQGVWQLLAAAYVFSIGEELVFTLSTGVYSNLVGLLFEIVTYYLVYKAIIETGLSRPYDLLFRGLQQREESLETALVKEQQRQKEVSALLEGSRAILKSNKFPQTARSIFDACKSLIGARAGYIALLSEDASHNELVFLDPGELPCTVDPSLPMPLRGLRAEAHRTSKTVFENDFAQSEWTKYLPSGHAEMDNVMFAPLIIESKVVGLLGLANKDGGFSQDDVRMATAFAELAAIALRNSQMWDSLEKSETRFRAVAQTARDAIVTIDSLGNIVLWNPGAEAIFGYSAEEIAGKPVTAIMPERLREAHVKGVARFFAGGEPKIMGRTVEETGLRKDGREVPIELTMSRWQAGDALFVTAIIRDISERKQAEAQLRTYERLATLGQVAGSISHEIRNPLAIIGTSVFFLENRLKDADDKVKQHLSRIHDSIQRSTSIIQSLLNLTQMKEPGFQNLDLKEVIAESIASAAAPETVKVALDFPEGPVVVRADREQLRMAFSNLITNAIQAMDSGGTLTVKLLKENNTVALSFTDTGPGIKPENMLRLFQPLFSTKSRGIGFGLSIAKMVAEKHGGSIEVFSPPGAGATFTVRLPLKQETVKESTHPSTGSG